MSQLTHLSFDNILMVHRNHVRLRGRNDYYSYYDFICLDAKAPKWLCLQYPNTDVPNNLGLALTSISIDAKDFVSTSVNKVGITADNSIVLKK